MPRQSMGQQKEHTPSVFPPITPFSFTQGSSALRKAKAVQNCSACRRRKTKCDRLWPCTPCKDRGEANLCEQYVKEPSDKPTGYTHVLDTSILANRVAQLEAVLSRLLTRVDSVDAYNDLLHYFKEPLPAFKPKDQEEREAHEREEYHKGEFDNKPDKRRDSVVSTDASRSISGGLAATMAPPATPGMLGMAQSRFAGTSVDTGSSGPAISNTTISPTNYSQQQTLGVDMNYLSSEGASGASPWLNFGSNPTPPTSSFVNPYADNSGNNPGSNNNNEKERESGFASKAPSAHEHNAALALEGMALGRELQGHRTSDPEDGDETNEPTPGSPLTFSSFIHHKRSFKQEGQLKSFPAVQRLPSILFGKYIINHFLENVDFRWRCLHRPTFEKQYQELSNRLRSKSVDFSREELSNIALYATCLAVGIHFLDEEGYRDLNVNEQQAEDFAATCWQVAYEALEASDWMQVHDVRSCQTIILAGIYLSSARRANQHWTMLGSATKVAMALGLASVPDEAKIISGQIKVPTRWRSAIDREVARRVWYCLLELDQLFAIEYGFLYLISPEISQTTEPANINDADIKESQPVVSLSRETHTEMSYFLQRLRLFYPFQGVVQKARREGRMRYGFVVEANEELQQAIANSPSFYQHSDNSGMDQAADAGQLFKIKREAIALAEGADLRLMRLHRSYFSEACHNPRYLLSKQTCLAGARRILNEHSTRGITNIHYWGHTYSLFAATMVMIIYLSYALPQELDDVKSQALIGIQQLRLLSHKRRTDLGETADILQSLMKMQMEKRVDSPSDSLKRNFGEMDTAEWEGWLPPDLLALARMNPGFMGDLAPPAGPSAPTEGGNQAQDNSMMFESILDDLHFNQSNFILM